MVKRIATTPVWDDDAMRRKKEPQRRLWRIHLTGKTHVVSAGVLTHLPKRTKICMRISGIGKNWICTAVNASLWARRDTSTRRTRDVTCVISWVNPGLIYETWPRICCYASTTQTDVFEFGALITLCSISVELTHSWENTISIRISTDVKLRSRLRRQRP